MTPTVMGIDPGTDGALAVLDGDSVILEPMPQRKDGGPDMPALFRLLAHYAPLCSRVMIEEPYIPMTQAQNIIRQIRHLGQIEGYLMSMRAPIASVRALDWSKHYPHGVEERDPKKRQPLIKRARRDIAAKLYPGIDLRRNYGCKTPHEGIVDALLIADFTMRQMKGQIK